MINWKVLFDTKVKGNCYSKNLKKVKVKKMSSRRKRSRKSKDKNHKRVEKGWKKNKKIERDSVFLKTAEFQKERKSRQN